jgi:hypothetical protein
MAKGRRSKAATKGLKPKKITSAQRRARKINIEVARRSKKRSGKSHVKGERIVASQMTRRGAMRTLKSLGMSEKESKAMLHFVSGGKKTGKISAKGLAFGLDYHGYKKAKLIF